MDALCPVDTQTSFSEDDFNIPLPEIKPSQLAKQRQKIIPVFPEEEIIYPEIAPGDLIQATKDSGETFLYLIIQQIDEQYITYRLDENDSQRYDLFENNLSIVSLCTELDAVIFHDPFDLKTDSKPATQSTTTKRTT